jgi:hypothetical protein
MYNSLPSKALSMSCRRVQNRIPPRRQTAFAEALVRLVIFGPSHPDTVRTYTEAARKAGYSERNARRLGSRAIRNPQVRFELRRLFHAYGAQEWGDLWP